MFALARGERVSPGDHIRKSELWRNAIIDDLLILVEFLYVLLRIVVTIAESFFKMFIPTPEKNLSGEIVLVTGSGHGIGQELVMKLAAEGCTVVGWDINEEGNAETYKLLKEKGLGIKAHFYKCDITKREEVLSLAVKVEKEVGIVSILLNNAGVMICKPLSAQTPENIQTVFNVNVMSHFWTMEAFIPKMKERNNGHIVAIASACGVVGLPYAVPYSASKFAVRGLMETISEELRVSENNTAIKFTTINPIMVDTGLAKKPKNRFPSIINILTTEEVTHEIIKAIKRETVEISVPASLTYFDRFLRLLPIKASASLKDFMGTGVDPE